MILFGKRLIAVVPGAGEFTVCAQLKILTTATFSVIILGTQLTETKWRALALLVLGCILVAIPGLTPSDGETGGMSSEMLLGYGALTCQRVLLYF